FGPDGFYFYTNRSSLKGRQLAANPRAAGPSWRWGARRPPRWPG
ncbi:MAG: pyridoxamine 5'-phosphate oxidase family protein, partial [Solirubrobacterales bacterium]